MSEVRVPLPRSVRDRLSSLTDIYIAVGEDENVRKDAGLFEAHRRLQQILMQDPAFFLSIVIALSDIDKANRNFRGDRALAANVEIYTSEGVVDVMYSSDSVSKDSANPPTLRLITSKSEEESGFSLLQLPLTDIIFLKARLILEEFKGIYLPKRELWAKVFGREVPFNSRLWKQVEVSLSRDKDVKKKRGRLGVGEDTEAKAKKKLLKKPGKRGLKSKKK